MEKKLYLSDSNKKVAGVCGGLGEYFNVDATLLRVLWVILVLFAGTGFLAYLIAWMVIPRRQHTGF
jgi:phage shock protein C